MNITDLEYGKVLVTGEIAFYLQHPKGRMITEENKTAFIQKWISKRLKKKIDRSDVRKCLQQVRKNLRCSQRWTKNLNSYLTHVENCKKVKELGKTDRELVNEALEALRWEGFCAKTDVNPTSDFTDEEAMSNHKKGSIIMLDVIEKRFDGDTVKKDHDLDFIVTTNDAERRALYVFLSKCFPIKNSDRKGIFVVGSAEGQINFTLKNINS